MYLNNTWLFLLLTCCYSVPVVVRIVADPDPWDPDHFAKSRSKAYFTLEPGEGDAYGYVVFCWQRQGTYSTEKKSWKIVVWKKSTYKKLYNKITVN